MARENLRYAAQTVEALREKEPDAFRALEHKTSLEPSGRAASEQEVKDACPLGRDRLDSPTLKARGGPRATALIWLDCFAGRLFRYLALQSIVPRPALATPQVLSGPRTAPSDRLADSYREGGVRQSGTALPVRD